MSQYLGDISAYALAVSQGYTGTEEEYAELMASYATVGQTAVNAAQTAKTKASEAATSATTATNKATEATTAAPTATTKAGEASTSASTATSAKDTAVSASQTATTKATEATTAAATAVSAKDDAVSANTAAQSAKTAAQTAQTGAETAAASVSASAAQIATNASDISQLKSDLTTMESDGVVPSAEQILSDNGVTDSVPYHYRKTGGNGADRLYDQIVGGTVCWNQLVANGDFSDGTTNWSASNATMSLSNGALTVVQANADGYITHAVPTVSGHKYINIINIKAPNGITFAFNSLIDWKTADGSWQTFYKIMPINVSSVYAVIKTTNITEETTWYLKSFMMFDLTAMFGSTIADYIYSLETAHAGDGVAFFKSLFPNDYYEYNVGELVSVSGLSAHVMRDADDNIIRSYPLDSTLTLRGIPKLDSNNKLYFDGDTYDADGTVTHNTILRAYQSGDESLANAITDGTNTVVYSANASTEQADPYQHLQQCDPNGTEEYVSTGIVPVGHNSFYPENLRAKVEGLPWNFASLIAPTEATFTATRNYTTGALFIVDNVLYKATANIANGGTITPNTNCTATTLAEIISALA